MLATSYPENEGDPSGHFVQTEIRKLEAEGHIVTVIAGRGSAFGWPGTLARLRERPWRAAVALRWAVSATRQLRTHEIDHAIAHWAVPCGFPIVLASLHERATLELVSHGADVRLLLRLPAPLREHIVNVLAERAAAWRFVSTSLMQSLCDVLKSETAAKVRSIAHIAPAPIELPVLAPRDAPIGFGSQEYAVSVGRLIASKQVDVAIAWAARRGVPLAIVGDGPEEQRLRVVAGRMGANVTWLGKLPRVQALSWIRDAHALVVASRDEGLSTVVREAEHLGTNVIDLTTGSRPQKQV